MVTEAAPDSANSAPKYVLYELSQVPMHFLMMKNDLKHYPYDIVLKTLDSQETRRAHKMPLGPFFYKELLKLSKGEDLTVDVSLPMLDLILTYIYEGQVEVPIAKLQEFKSAAQVLEIDIPFPEGNNGQDEPAAQN